MIHSIYLRDVTCYKCGQLIKAPYKILENNRNLGRIRKVSKKNGENHQINNSYNGTGVGSSDNDSGTEILINNNNNNEIYI